MNPFVNFKQRGIELPAGCKNLIDALRQGKWRGSTTNRICSHTICEMEGQVSRLLNSAARDKCLVVSASIPPTVMVVEFGPFVWAYRPSGLSVLVYVDGAEPLQEQAVRAVFEEAGFSPFWDFGLGGGTDPMRMLRYPLPDTGTEAASLVTTVFRKGFGVSDQALFAFDYHERPSP